MALCLMDGTFESYSNLNLYILVCKSTHYRHLRSWVMRWKTEDHFRVLDKNWKFVNKKIFEIPAVFEKKSNMVTYFIILP